MAPTRKNMNNMKRALAEEELLAAAFRAARATRRGVPMNKVRNALKEAAEVEEDMEITNAYNERVKKARAAGKTALVKPTAAEWSALKRATARIEEAKDAREQHVPVIAAARAEARRRFNAEQKQQKRSAPIGSTKAALEEGELPEVSEEELSEGEMGRRAKATTKKEKAARHAARRMARHQRRAAAEAARLETRRLERLGRKTKRNKSSASSGEMSDGEENGGSNSRVKRRKSLRRANNSMGYLPNNNEP
jgi:hypothetical protein